MPSQVAGAEERPRPSPALRHALFGFLLLHLLFPALWFVQLAQYGPRPNDWLHLKIVADHFVAGEWAHLYSAGEASVNPGYLWRYPPFALYLVAPLAWLSEFWAYATLAAIEILALTASLVLLARTTVPPGRREIWVLATVVSAPALSTVIAGQSSALILLCVVGAAVLSERVRPRAAGLVLGLLAVKPNWGAFFGLHMVAAGAWRQAGAMLAAVAVLCAASLPLGGELWLDFLRLAALNDAVMQGYEPFKVITLKGFLDALFGQGLFATVLWLSAAAALAGVTIAAWRTPALPMRHLGLTLLLAVAVNPYASFYDALVLVLPATVWWADRALWRRGPWLTVGILIAIAWCAEQYVYTWSNVLRPLGADWRPPFSLVGPAVTIWLLLAAREAIWPRPLRRTA